MSSLIDRRAVAELLGVCQRTVTRIIDRGELPVVRIGRRVLVRREAVHQFIMAREAAAFREPIGLMQ